MFTEWQQRSEIEPSYPRRFLINFWFSLIFRFSIFDKFSNIFMIFHVFFRKFSCFCVFSNFYHVWWHVSTSFTGISHIYMFTECHWQQWFFIYSVTTSMIYSMTVTTSDSTVSNWKSATFYIFIDNDNNNLDHACQRYTTQHEERCFSTHHPF